MKHRYEVLDVFFNEPLEEHYFREIVRKTGISPNYVAKNLKSLESEELIYKEGKKGGLVLYSANRENLEFIRMKKAKNISLLINSGLVEAIAKALSPKAILLFGSYATGTDTEKSDIDIAVIVHHELEKKIEISKFERLLGRKISIEQISRFPSLSKEMKNGIVNGILLYGYLEAF
ncbi:hypothetical protein COV21_03620 [Candidatus Woesearchaeota archaeon CG10_big_fil_rev_8_21_14_0_10_45_5]|nr:MAG: hypothetical protein COV21_03620 [Candidatus Woesearchaeota archaeon CG10_big_fil_rev_8_21_14_0_10_45_5]PIU29985.1 MAG: hypothetical protein COT07_03130 [Candidatus Woesearchaeota archaeon CG07_land_8_20_14_0_80_44_23]